MRERRPLLVLEGEFLIYMNYKETLVQQGIELGVLQENAYTFEVAALSLSLTHSFDSMRLDAKAQAIHSPCVEVLVPEEEFYESINLLRVSTLHALFFISYNFVGVCHPCESLHALISSPFLGSRRRRYIDNRSSDRHLENHSLIAFPPL